VYITKFYKVIELLRHSIRYEMPFAKFIPSYHHHFGRQCRVSDYGFSKLAELFEAISDTVMCVSPNGLSPSLECGTEDKIIRLVPQEQIKVIQVCFVHHEIFGNKVHDYIICHQLPLGNRGTIDQVVAEKRRHWRKSVVV